MHLLFVIIYVCHVFSCLWFYVAVLEEQSGIISWVKTYNLDEDSPFLLYANAFYYATVTVIILIKLAIIFHIIFFLRWIQLDMGTLHLRQFKKSYLLVLWFL